MLRRDDALEAAAAGEATVWPWEGMALGLALVHRRERAADRCIEAVAEAVAEKYGTAGGNVKAQLLTKYERILKKINGFVGSPRDAQAFSGTRRSA